jgi:hypothetical protein
VIAKSEPARNGLSLESTKLSDYFEAAICAVSSAGVAFIRAKRPCLAAPPTLSILSRTQAARSYPSIILAIELCIRPHWIESVLRQPFTTIADKANTATFGAKGHGGSWGMHSDGDPNRDFGATKGASCLRSPVCLSDGVIITRL